MNIQTTKKNRTLNPRDFWALIRGLNLWTLRERIKDFTVHRKSTITLLQKIDVVQWNNPAKANIDGLMLSVFFHEPWMNPNLRFRSNLAQSRQRYITQHGKLSKTTGHMKSHSFVIQFQQFMEVYLAHNTSSNAHVISILDTGNTARSEPNTQGAASGSYAFAYTTGVEAPSTTTTYGIQIGTGTTAPTNTDYTIETLIANGVGAGKMTYGACGVCSAAVVGSNVDLTITRAFSNSSGGTITIREITLVGDCTQGISMSTYYHFLLARDAVNQAVTNGQSCVVTYTIRTTV